MGPGGTKALITFRVGIFGLHVTGTTRGGHPGEAVQANGDHSDLNHQCLLLKVTARALRVRGRRCQPLQSKAHSPSSISILGSSQILISASYKKGPHTTILL